MRVIARKAALTQLEQDSYSFTRLECYILCLANKPTDIHTIVCYIHSSQDDYVCTISDTNIVKATVNLITKGYMALA